MRIFVFVSIVIAMSIWLTGCATADKTYTPDGRVGYTVECNGMVLSWGSCYEKAGDICGARGYDVISKTGNSAATLSSNQYGTYGGSAIYRSMLIACKKPSKQK